MSASPTWIQIIDGLLRSQPGLFKLILDPAGLTQGETESGLQNCGWRCLEAATPFDLRLHYERFYRQAPPDTPTLLRLKFGPQHIPYDLAHQFETVDLSPAALFPGLQPELLSGLPTDWYAALYQQQGRPAALRLSAAQTVRHILAACLKINLPAGPGPGDLLHLLARLLGQQTPLPPQFAPHILPGNLAADVGKALGDLRVAGEFLQNVWQGYAHTLAASRQVAEDGLFVELAAWIEPLENDPQVQKDFTQLCLASELPPLQVAPDHVPLPGWLQAGLHYQVDVSGYLRQEIERLSQQIPASTADFNAWGEFASLWANWRTLYRQHRQQAHEIQADYARTCQALAASFYGWLESSYRASLRYPYLPRPYCVHHVLPYLASRCKPTPKRPLAVIVMDGMAWEDWLVLEPLLDIADVQYETLPILALIPTLTSISRQALLSGKLPAQFPQDWQNTNAEKAHWIAFWKNHGLQQEQITYLRGLGKPGCADLTAEALTITAQPNLAAAALIVNGIDDLLHANALQDFTFQGEVLAWARRAGFIDFIRAMRRRFATLVITSDHGHITGRGVGRLPVEHLSSEGSLRAALFQPALPDALARQLSAVLTWRDHGLPDDLMAVFPAADGIFAAVGEERITHGGPSLEEVLIPLVIITAEE